MGAIRAASEQERLWKIARKLLERERSYTREHLISKLELHLRVSHERAEQGFHKLLEHGVLEPTLQEPPHYFISDSTPF